MDVGLPRPVARRLRERLPRLRPAKGALRARRRLRRRGRLQGPEVGCRPLVQERPQRRGQDGQGDTVARRHPGMGAVPRDRGAQGPRRRPRRGDREARGGEAAAPGVPSPPRLCLRRHDAGRQPPEVLDVRLPQVARRHTPVSVNLFFTSFAKQARRSRKGGFTGCANVFSPIPVTA